MISSLRSRGRFIWSKYMPMGLVDDSDFEKELERLNQKPKIESHIKDTPHRGRSEGDKNVPEHIREIIGETAVIQGRARALELAESFGVSPSSVSAYAKGATSTASIDRPQSGLVNHLNKSRARATKKAVRVMQLSLDGITPDKLDKVRVRDLAGIAKDMSVLIKSLEPPASQDNTSGGQYVIYAPTFRDERSFEVIQVKE